MEFSSVYTADTFVCACVCVCVFVCGTYIFTHMHVVYVSFLSVARTVVGGVHPTPGSEHRGRDVPVGILKNKSSNKSNFDRNLPSKHARK